MNNNYQDMTTEIAGLGMYSYERPSSIFWNAVANGLIARGLTKAEAMEWLASKNARWILDSYEDTVEKAAASALSEYLIAVNKRARVTRSRG